MSIPVALLLAAFIYGSLRTPFFLAAAITGVAIMGLGGWRRPAPLPAQSPVQPEAWVSRRDHDLVVLGLIRRTRVLGIQSSIECFHRFRGFSAVAVEAQELSRLCEGTSQEIETLMGRVRRSGQDGASSPHQLLDDLIVLRAQMEGLCERIIRVGAFSESQRRATQRAMATTAQFCRESQAGEPGDLARTSDELALVAEGLRSLVGAIKP